MVLLTFSYCYVNSHPAEEIAFFSGFKMIFQNTEIFLQNMFGGDGDLLKQKYALENYYQAMLFIADEKPCIQPQVAQDLYDIYQRLLAEPKSTLSYTLDEYIHWQFEFDKMLRAHCDTFEVLHVDDIILGEDVTLIEDTLPIADMDLLEDEESSSSAANPSDISATLLLS
jgi:hypothetical protein